MSRATFFETSSTRRVGSSESERSERHALGLPSEAIAVPGLLRRVPSSERAARMRPVRAPQLLNAPSDYPQPVSFSRGLRVDVSGPVAHLLLSGTASVGADGETAYPGDFRAQCWRTYRNLTGLLESEGATWHDVARTTCYLRDIERDYADFNAIRTEFFLALDLRPFPASTAIQARLCRSDLLVEIELHAIIALMES